MKVEKKKQRIVKNNRKDEKGERDVNNSNNRLRQW